jgi:hypothetical protein
LPLLLAGAFFIWVTRSRAQREIRDNNLIETQQPIGCAWDAELFHQLHFVEVKALQLSLPSSALPPEDAPDP